VQGKMTTQKINNVKHTFGFFSMTIAWTLMNILNSIYLVSEDGKAVDSGVIIFWSGLFITIAWSIFIIWPLSQLDHSKKIFKPQIFTLVSTVYGALTYSIIVGGIFRSFELVTMFLPQAILVGLFFGLAYSILIRQEKLIDLLNQRPLTKTFFFLSPAIILGFFLWFLPLIAPNLVYRFMTDEVRHKIVARTIPKFQVGDEIEPL